MLSIWEKESFYAPADIIIVGGGFVGLWSAYFMKKKHPSLRVTMIDRGIIPTGASTRNAGFACFGSVTELLQDHAKMGEDRMLQLVEMRYRGLARIRKTFKKKEIDFCLCGGYEPLSAHDLNRYPDLEDKLHWINKKVSAVVDKKHPFKFADKCISDFGLAGIKRLIHTSQEGCLHPGKLCQALLRSAQGAGVTVLTGIEIKSYEVSTSGVTLITDKGVELRAQQLLVCTNGFAKQLLPDLEVVPARGQVLVTAPIPGLKLNGTFHYNEGFYYFRNLGNRILLGGARNLALQEEHTYDMDTSTGIQQALEKFLSTHILPGIPYVITDRWSGIMGLGPEKMPIVRKLAPRVYCAVRMSGMGVALAPVVGESVAQMML